MELDTTLLIPLAVALGLGLLVGLQREVVDEPLGGIRTYPLFGLAGVLAGLLDGVHGGSAPSWLSAGGLLAVVAFATLGKWASAEHREAPVGVTGAIAGVVVYLLGLLCVAGHLTLAAVAGGAVVVLLHLKDWSHRVIARFSDRDVRAGMQLVVVALVVLPLVPDRTFGPYDVLNPFETWLMVVFIVGLNLAGYVAWRLVGQQKGALLGSALGGLVSSTATTASYARQVKSGLARPLGAVAIMVASTVLVARVFVEVGAISGAVLADMAAPLGVLLAAHVVIAAVAWWRAEPGEAPDEAGHSSPAQLKAALIFGALYAVIKLGVAAAEEELGQGALYGVAVISGLTDVDAITLSTAQLVEEGRIEASMGWRVIVTAALANLVFKAGMAFALGGRGLGLAVSKMFGIAAAAGLALLFLWPG